MTTPDTTPGSDAADVHRRFGVDLFNAVWRLMERDDRSPDDDLLMVHTAHASAYHWRQVGRPANFARSEWLCSRVYAVLRRSEPALHHARHVLRICESHGIGDWDLGFAYEALARAHAVAGEADEARRWVAKAREQSALVAEDDDRELLLADLETIA